MSKYLNIICVVSLLFLSQASESLDNDIEKLKETAFGQTIIETIQMELEDDSPVQNLVQMFQNLDSSLEAEQERDDDIHKRFLNNCENDQNEIKDVIAQCTTSSKLLKSEIDQLSPQKIQKVSNLVRSNEELKDLNGELEKQRAVRKEEQLKYEKTLDDMEGSLFAVNQAKKLYNDFLDVLLKNKKRFASSDAFLQKSQSDQQDNQDESYHQYNDFDDDSSINTLAQVGHQVIKLKHNIQEEGTKIMLQALAQMSTKVEDSNPAAEQEALVRKVITIISQLGSFIQKSRMAEDQAEASRQKAFLSVEQMFTDQIIFSQKTQGDLQGSIELLNNQIQDATNEKFEQDQKIEAKQNQMNDRGIECTNEKLDYAAGSTKRDGEREALAEALDIITTKLGQLKSKILQGL